MSELARRYPQYAGRAGSIHGSQASAALESRWAPIGPLFDSLSRAKATILGKVALSPLGKDEAIADLAASEGAPVRSRLLSLKETIRREYDVGLIGDENAAQIGMKPHPSMAGAYVRDESARIEPTPENTMLAVEVRASLKGMKQREVTEAYLSAVADGSDPMLVFAIENVPSPRLALVDQATLDAAREIRISRSRMRASIEMQRDLFDINVLLLDAAWRELATTIPIAADDTPPLAQRRSVKLPFGVERVTQPLAS